ncbi:hypothetical protein CWR43_14060 [Rhizobium sullae]|uniref:Uncharacterized protein n=1 Tax=Rhizobium sullae TaxID=50338 RepID=A0A2N0DAM5_RHISU|nr:hypothetical protein CWR43_14060 [Rhizobium sullae]
MIAGRRKTPICQRTGRLIGIAVSAVRSVIVLARFASFSPLVPVLGFISGVHTGIQLRRVGGTGDSSHAKDFAWLASCDEHRNEGGEIAALPNRRRLTCPACTSRRDPSGAFRQPLPACRCR